MKACLSANFSALWRFRWFWLGSGTVLAWALFRQIQSFIQISQTGSSVGIDTCTLGLGDAALPLLFLVAALCSLYMNRDYHDGVIRGKLVAGRSRAQVYLANFLTMLAAALIYQAIFTAASLALGLALLPDARPDFGQILKTLLLSLPYLASVTGIFTLFSTQISSRAMPVLAIVLAAVLLWLPHQLFDRLGESDQRPVQDATVSEQRGEDGQIQLVYEYSGKTYENLEDLPTEPNPRYVPEPLRSLYTFLFDSLPGSQATNLSPLSPPWVPALYSLLMAALATGAGLAFFQQKNIK